MVVVDILREQDEAKTFTYELLLWPKRWQEVETILERYEWKTVRFEPATKRVIPKVAGIYTFVALPQIAGHPSCAYVMYIGKTSSLNRRFGEYLNERKRETGRPKVIRMLNKYPQHLWFCFIQLPESKLKDVEEAFLYALKPPFNDRFVARIQQGRAAFQ